VRQAEDIRTAPLLAASIFLDVLTVFLLFLSIFGRNDLVAQSTAALAE
jgi:hypothetical protein